MEGRIVHQHGAQVSIGLIGIAAHNPDGMPDCDLFYLDGLLSALFLILGLLLNLFIFRFIRGQVQRDGYRYIVQKAGILRQAGGLAE